MNKENKAKNKLIKFLKNKNIYCLYAFIISSLLAFLSFYINGMVNNNSIFFRSDMIEGIAYIKDFARCILNHENVYFSFNSGLGLNNSFNIACDVLSPFNILYLLFFNCDDNLVTLAICVLKIGFIGLSFQIFSKRCLKNEEFSSVIISVFFSLCAFVVAYGTINISWLDSVIILPLLCAEVINCIENNKRVGLIILYAYLFISQFYMGYMVGFFSLVVTLAYLIILYDPKTEKPIKERIGIFFNGTIAVVISIMISAVVWVPALFFLLANRVPDSTSVIGIDTSIFQIINSLFWGISYNINGKYSYIYCGLPCIILNVLYFTNKDINKKEKLFSTVILSFLFLCMIFTPLNSLLHLFDQPDDFWYRYSYLISFCVCAISARQLIFMSNITVKKIFAIYGFVMLFYLIMHRSSGLNTLIPDEYTRLNTNPGFIFCSIALLLWCILLRLVYIKRVRNFLMILFSLSLLSVELLSNSKYEVFFKYDYEEYNNWYSNSKRIADELNEKDESLYRTIIVNTLGYCSDTWFDVNGVADFGNQEKYAVRKFLSNIGFATSPRVTMENGYNPVSELILGVKYVIDGHTDNDYVYTKGSIYEEELHENEYYLGMGYLVPGDLITYNYPGRNVFENLNSVVNSLSGLDKDCFKPVDENDISNESYYIFKSEVPDGYFRIDRIGNIGQYGFIVYNHDPNTVYIQFENSEAAFYGSDYVVLETTNAAYGLANLAELSCSNQMKYNPDKNRHETYLYSEIDYCPEEFECSSVNIYYLDKDAFEEQYNELSKNQLEIYEYSRGNIKGKINVTGNKRLLFTTIPYDPAWKAYINGIETETVRVIDGAFMGIYLPKEGNFDVEFAFEAPGLKIGRIISLCGLIALLSVIFEKKLKKKK